ncbi:hypothetical protein MAHJHV51_48100 [Mycobacterium avium subsp. hominissuis]
MKKHDLLILAITQRLNDNNKKHWETVSRVSDVHGGFICV